MRPIDRARFLAQSAVYLGGSHDGEGTDAGHAGRQRIPRLAGRFNRLAGSAANADRLGAALRTGFPVCLRTPRDRSRSRAFRLPTGPLPTADVATALLLTQCQLDLHGLRSPTPRDLEAALIGNGWPGTAAAAFPGVLRLRARGMDWNEIARRVAATVDNQAGEEAVRRRA